MSERNKTVEAIVAGTLLVGAAVGTAKSCSALTQDEDKTPVTSSLPSDIGDFDIELDYEFSIGNYVQEEIDYQEYIGSEITQDEIESVQENTAVEEIREMIEDINSQPFEIREQSELTVDLGLLAYLKDQHPSLNLPHIYFHFEAFKNEDSPKEINPILYANECTKDNTPYTNYNSLVYNFSQYPEKVDEDAVLFRQSYGSNFPWADNIYGGNIKLGNYKVGDIVMILDDDIPNPITVERVYPRVDVDGNIVDTSATWYTLLELNRELDNYSDYDSEERWLMVEEKVNSEKEIKSLNLGFILDEKIDDNGEKTLIMVKANNETREIEIFEITNDNIEEILGVNRFSIRRKLFGHESRSRLMEEPFSFHSDYDLINRHFTTDVVGNPSLWRVNTDGTTLFSFDIYGDGYLNRNGKLRRVSVPAGFLFNIQEIVTIKDPTWGDTLEIGLLGDISQGYANSVIVISVTDSEGTRTSFLNEMNQEDQKDLEAREYFKNAPLINGYLDKREFYERIHRVSSKLEKTGWENNEGIPFYVDIIYGGRSPWNSSFEEYFRTNEGFYNCLSKGICNTPLIRDIYHLQYKINMLASSYPGKNFQEGMQLSQEWLPHTNWNKLHEEWRLPKGEKRLPEEVSRNIETAIRYLDYGKVDGQPLQAIPFQVALSLLYPELNIQSVGGATVIGEDGKERGAITVDELIPEELKKNPDLLSAQTGYGGTMNKINYTSSSSLFEFLQEGDTILVGNSIRIIVGKFEDEDGDPIILMAEGNRYLDGYCFIAEISKNTRGPDALLNMDIGAEDLVGRNKDIYVLRSNNK